MNAIRYSLALLYFPVKAAVVDVVSSQLHAWPASEDFRGLIAEPATPARGTVIVFHGNAGHVGHRAFYAAVLTRLEWRVTLAEYPGYGPRGGQLGEGPLVEDAEQTLLRARQHYGAPLLVIGESLGAGVAAAASARQPGRSESSPWRYARSEWNDLASASACCPDRSAVHAQSPG